MASFGWTLLRIRLETEKKLYEGGCQEKMLVRTENFVTLYFQKFRAISSNPYPSQMALSVNS